MFFKHHVVPFYPFLVFSTSYVVSAFLSDILLNLFSTSQFVLSTTFWWLSELHAAFFCVLLSFPLCFSKWHFQDSVLMFFCHCIFPCFTLRTASLLIAAVQWHFHLLICWSDLPTEPSVLIISTFIHTFLHLSWPFLFIWLYLTSIFNY